MSNKNQIGYSLVFWETLKEYDEKTKWYKPVKNKRVEICQELSDELSDNEEIQSMLIDKMFGYKDDIKQMLKRGEYTDIPSYHKESLEKDQRIAELEEQLKNAIVSKFKIGDKCWAIRNATNIYNEPKQVLIKEITITKNCIKYYAKNGCLTNRTNKTTMHIQSQLFATKEEAQAKLKELQGK